MASHTITSEQFPDGFPDNTKLNVEWVKGQRTVRDKKTGETRVAYSECNKVWRGYVEGSFTYNYDPGKYVWKAHKSSESGLDNFSERGEFLVGMTEEQFKRYSHVQPDNAKPYLTTEGVRYQCTWAGCKKSSTSMFAAVEHENNIHRGQSLIGKDENHTDPIKRGPGRPPKSSYGVGANAD